MFMCIKRNIENVQLQRSLRMLYNFLNFIVISLPRMTLIGK